MKRTNIFLTAAAMGLLMLCGCDNTPVGWFKTEGGYINLSQVTCIESNGVVKLNDVEIYNGVLDDEKIMKLRSDISSSNSQARITLHAAVRFDKNNIVALANGTNVSVNEALIIIDSWSDAMDRLNDQLPEL